MRFLDIKREIGACTLGAVGIEGVSVGAMGGKLKYRMMEGI